MSAVKRVERACARAENEYPLLTAPDGTAAVTIADLRAVLQRLAEVEGALALMPDEIEVFRIMQATGGPRAEMAKAVGRRIEELRNPRSALSTEKAQG